MIRIDDGFDHGRPLGDLRLRHSQLLLAYSLHAASTALETIAGIALARGDALPETSRDDRTDLPVRHLT